MEAERRVRRLDRFDHVRIVDKLLYSIPFIFVRDFFWSRF